jgi:hypothetical protein
MLMQDQSYEARNLMTAPILGVVSQNVATCIEIDLVPYLQGGIIGASCVWQTTDNAFGQSCGPLPDGGTNV